MKIDVRFPNGTNGNCDFITKKARVAEGERVVVCDVDVEALPPRGLLCLHENTVKMMVDKLGWALQTPEHRAEVKKLRAELKEHLEVRSRLEEAFATVKEMV